MMTTVSEHAMRQPPPHVRRATHADVDALSPLFDQYRQFYGQRPDLERARVFLSERIRQRESAILLATHGGVPTAAMGFVQLYPCFSSVSAERSWILNDLFVAPHARRQGVATLLMDAARRHAKLTRAVWIELATGRDNSDARRLYEALGYREDRVFVTYRLTP
jgi:ribosomal protein S18 acetylase RimI-like enzyme